MCICTEFKKQKNIYPQTSAPKLKVKPVKQLWSILKAPNRDWAVSIKAPFTGITIYFRAVYLIQVQPGDTCEMALIAKKAASWSFVIPLRLGGRRPNEVGQNELKRFTGIWAAGKMAWQWKTYREADSCPEGTHINAGIRRKRARLCFQASHATTDIVTPWEITRAEPERH